MKLRDVGETCIIDFHTVIDWALRTISKRMPEHHIDIIAVENTIAEIFDRALTIQMHWTKVKDFAPEDTYLRSMGLSDMPDGECFIEDLFVETTDLLKTFLTLPTWHTVFMRSRGTYAHIELGENFIIDDWLKKHAKEYGVRYNAKRW